MMNIFHQEVWEIENTSLSSDQRWEKWLKEVSRISGIQNLDGDQKGDGYSLDYAYESYCDGRTPQEYAKLIQSTLPKGKSWKK